MRPCAWRRLAAVDDAPTSVLVPLANNETPEGRLRNRRIDLLIQPNLDALVTEISAN